MRTAEDNLGLIERFWSDLYRRDFDAVGAYFAPDGQYTDVFTPDDDLAVGADQIAARLRLGLEPLSDIVHHPGPMLADGRVVMTEHGEQWHWPTGETFLVRFVSVHEVDDEGAITRWWDYPDLQGLLAAAPAWWIDHIMAGYAATGIDHQPEPITGPDDDADAAN